MPRFGPIKRQDLIRYLRRAGFSEMKGGRSHDIMRRDDVTVRLPNPHGSVISKDLLSRLLRQAGISREEWERL